MDDKIDPAVERGAVALWKDGRVLYAEWEDAEERVKSMYRRKAKLVLDAAKGGEDSAIRA